MNNDNGGKTASFVYSVEYWLQVLVEFNNFRYFDAKILIEQLSIARFKILPTGATAVLSIL